MNPVPALSTRALVRRFGALLATDSVDLDVAAGSRHALIGPNGAGKTTLINLLSGFLRPSSGSVLLDGDDITSVPQHLRVRRGLVRTFQINRLFAELDPLESVALAIAQRSAIGARWWRPLGDYRACIDEAAELLRRLHLLELAHRPTRELAYGKQRLLEIALALAMHPRVLLLDEPAAGVPAAESRELFEILAQLPRSITIVLIEHDMDLVFRFAERISVLVGGALLADGDPRAIAADPRVRQVYLGEQTTPGVPAHA